MKNLALFSLPWLLSPALVVASASAAIVYVDIPEVEEGFFHFPPDDPAVHSRTFDFNGDGVDDSEFKNTTYNFFVVPSSTTEMIGEAGQDLAHLQAGALIGASQTASLQWLSTPLGMAFGFNDGGNVVGGTWYGTGEGYLGFRFAAEDGWHYGWMRVHAIGHWGGLFRDYAYETTPGVPIFAGQIPEPSSLMMASLALALVFLRRWRWIRRGAGNVGTDPMRGVPWRDGLRGLRVNAGRVRGAGRSVRPARCRPRRAGRAAVPTAEWRRRTSWRPRVQKGVDSMTDWGAGRVAVVLTRWIHCG